MGRIGHNGGPESEGASWRRQCWAAARAELLPVLPIEVIRTRVKRAQSLGLDYKTYAGVRAASGRDVVAFLFSSNALRVTVLRPAMAEVLAAKLAGVEAGRLGLASAPLRAAEMEAANPVLEACHPAPYALGKWRESREAIRAALGRRAPSAVVLIGSHVLEAEWVAAGRLAAYLPAERFFGAALVGR